jgi:hypothetical protein
MEHNVSCLGLLNERLHDRSTMTEPLMLWQKHNVEDDGPVDEIRERTTGTNDRRVLVRKASNATVLKGLSQYLGFALAERRTLKHYGKLVPVDGFETCDELDGHETSDR